MITNKECTNVEEEQIQLFERRKAPMIGLSIVVGLLVGIVTVGYRLALEYAEKFAFWVAHSAKTKGIGFILVWFLGLIVLSLLVAKCVQLNKSISGSGIPQVKGVLQGCLSQDWWKTLYLKFIGGTLVIMGGLSVGREGPSIQLGACVGQGIGKKAKVSYLEEKILIAGGASAGLAAAFNAPLAGVLFVLEEVFKYFSPLILLVSMGAAVVADFISKQVFGVSAVFSFETGVVPLGQYGFLVLLGVILGVGGVIYNKTLLSIQKRYKQIKFLNHVQKIMVPFVLAGLLGIVFPLVLGGGHAIVEVLNIKTALSFMIILLVVKFLFSIICFCSGVPGGIFFPLLIIGGLIGSIFAKLGITYWGIDPSLFYNFVIVGMAGYFTAIVRAPITGIVLIAEMTGSFANFLPLTLVSIIAYIVAEGLKCAPIYDSLLENQLEGKDLGINKEEHHEKVIIWRIVKHGSLMCGKQVKDIEWPNRSLLLTVERMGNKMMPSGQMTIQAEDVLQVVTDLNNEWQARNKLDEWTNELD